MKAPDVMTAGQINAELDRLDAQSSKLNEALIAAGRGTEVPSETMRKTDALSLRWIANLDRAQALRREIYRRMGGDYRRMGKGVKPIKTNPRKRKTAKKSNPAPTKKQVTVYTRSKRAALAEAEKRGINAPIAVKVKGGFVVYQAYARSKNPSRAALKSETGLRLARAALSGAYSAKRARNPRMLQAKISYAQGIIEALHKVGAMTAQSARTYISGLRDLLRS